MKWLVGMALAVLVIAGCGQSGNEPEQAQKKDFTLTAAPGTNMDGAIEKFKTLVVHCPGIYKYKADVESVEYLSQGHADFLVTVVGKPTILPAQSYGMGHTCHFNVEESKATVSKRPCAWLCTGEDMTGIDGENHSYAQGKLVGSLNQPNSSASTADEIAKKLQQAAANAPAPDFMTVLDAAKRGDYQSQRNLAYGYAAHPYPGQEKNRVLGCAWYLVILNSGHPQVNAGDESNVQTYCGVLEKALLETSKARAIQFLGEIKAEPKGK